MRPPLKVIWGVCNLKADSDESAYEALDKSITDGEAWFSKKSALCKGMITAANRSAGKDKDD